MTDTPAGTGAAALIERLRADGWAVAIHNDYWLAGERKTFWLLTNKRGYWVKGEGATDAEALALCAKDAGLWTDIVRDRDALRAQLAKAREAIEKWYEARKAAVAETPADVRTNPKFGSVLADLAFAESALVAFASTPSEDGETMR